VKVNRIKWWKGKDRKVKVGVEMDRWYWKAVARKVIKVKYKATRL
jgi:hypothetical protein